MSLFLLLLVLSVDRPLARSSTGKRLLNFCCSQGLDEKICIEMVRSGCGQHFDNLLLLER